MNKSILVVTNEELQFLKNLTNQYRQSNLKPEYYSVVEKIRSNELQDTTELLGALKSIIDNTEWEFIKENAIRVHNALGGIK